jgi:hypothetical protein
MDEVDPADLPDWLTGFSVALVKELDDLVRAFGVDDPAAKVRRAELPGPPRVCVSSALTDYRAVLIGDQPGIADLSRSFVCRFGRGESYVIWQRGVTVESVRALIGQLRLVSRAFGADSIEGVLGTMAEDDNRAACRYSVDEHFRVRGQLSIPLQGTDGIERLAAGFDRPDEVAVAETLLGHGICRKSDLPFVQERERVVRLLLAQYGITTPEQVRNLAPGELEKVYAIVGAELDKVFGG